MSSAKLYTPELLSLTVELADWPAIEAASMHGNARAATCGSTLALDAELDGKGAISNLGLKVRACAVGQAAAAIFARHAIGRDLPDIARTADQLLQWLRGQNTMPDWPDLMHLEPARGYSARHGAIMLPWNAAIQALSSTPQPS